MKLQFTKEELKDIETKLYEYNMWRRGYDDYNIPDPKELGIIIDKTILIIRGLINNIDKKESLYPKKISDL